LPSEGKLKEETRLLMVTEIMNGFPLRRCSWFFNPIVPNALSRKMIRWLDLVCLKQVALKT